MPGWHARTAELVAAGSLRVVGIVQEQHPDRARLFMQWQKMDWPVLADSYNQLGVEVVPMTFLIDEYGTIRFKNPKEDELAGFLATDVALTAWMKPLPVGNFELEDLEKRVKARPEDAVARFQLGVAYRMRFDAGTGAAGDFGNAIASWRKALELHPDQYIWRRRIQQYGPRLDKPYSFYDWVNQARSEITDRGEIPSSLSAEPGGSELAYPDGGNEANFERFAHPDPGGLVSVDVKRLIAASAVVVPSTKGEGRSFRVHLAFNPQDGSGVHWTNEAGNLTFFLENENVEVLDQQGPGEVPGLASTAETRRIEFEVRLTDGEILPKNIKGRAYYFICEGAGGVCQFLRQDVVISLDPRVP